MPERAQKFYAIPKGTRPSECRGSTCKAVFFWVRPPGGERSLPIDPEVPGGHWPTEREEGLGVIHHAVCPDVEEFKRKKVKR